MTPTPPPYDIGQSALVARIRRLIRDAVELTPEEVERIEQAMRLGAVR